MGFLDSLTKKTSELGKKTSEATSKIAKETKLKLKINENKGKIKTLYEDIGKKIYEHHVSDVDDGNPYVNEKCNEIDGLTKEIEDAKKEIMILNNKKNCQQCSAEIENTASFCPKCGAKQEEAKKEDEETEKIEEQPIEEKPIEEEPIEEEPKEEPNAEEIEEQPKEDNKEE